MTWSKIRNVLLEDACHPGGWRITDVRSLTVKERNNISHAVVAAGKYCPIISFDKKDGTTSFIPLLNQSHLKEDEVVNPCDLKIVTLSRYEETIYRAVEKKYAPRYYKGHNYVQDLKKHCWYKILRPIRNLHWKIVGRRITMFDDVVLY